MRRAERFIHSMPAAPTVTMPTSTESRIARVRSAIELALARERLELDLLRLHPRHVGEHGDRLVEAVRAAGAAHRERIPAQLGRGAPAASSIGVSASAVVKP